MDQKKMGKTISFLRKQFNMTQKQLANRLGVSDKTISKWETGHGAPDISVLTKLSISLDIDIENLLEGNLTYPDFKWKGILVLNYPENIHSYMILQSLPIVEFQLSLLMLTGINHIIIIGIENEIAFTRDILDIDNCGIQIEYECANVADMESINAILERNNSRYGIMMIYGLDSIYGKDLTKLFRRVIYNSEKPTRLENYQYLPLSICLYPQGTYRTLKNFDIHKEERFEKLILKRGIVAFHIQSREDLWDASVLIHIIERHMGERIGYLKDIAERSGLL